MATYKIECVTPTSNETPGTHKDSVDINPQTVDRAEQGDGGIKKEGDKTTVVMDGPLSQIYTRALNIVFSKDADETPALESAAIDSMIATSMVLDVREKKAELMKEGDGGLYVYATDNEKLPEEGGAVLDNLHLALDHKPASNVVLAVEMIGDGNISPMQVILEEYAQKSGIRVIHSKDAVMSFLRNRINP